MRTLVDPAVLAARFAAALRRAGVPASPERAGWFVRALALVPPDDRASLYWAARLVFVSSVEHLDAFELVFAEVFGGAADALRGARSPRGPHEQERPPSSRPRPAPPLPWATPAPGGNPLAATGDSDGEADDGGPEALLAAASPAERLRHTAFADLASDELDELRHLIGRLRLAPPPRRTRRTRRHPAGDRVDLRGTLRRAQRTAGDPVRWSRRRRRERPRRLVLLCDVSGSMEPYARAFLTLLQGAVSGASAEAFVFATRLTRLTRVLDGRDVDAALARAAATAPDWSGGTRLGASLRSFVRDHGEHARGAVVVVLSDGWAGDDPAVVAEQMARLRRLAARIVWVNPRRAAPGYAPLAGGMAAALPYTDAFVSGHSLAALDDVVAAVAGRG